MNTNGGLIKLQQNYDISYINDIWYLKKSINNIISMKSMTDKFRIKMDSKEEMVLLVHMPNKIVKFKKISNRLYAMDTNDKKSLIITKKISIHEFVRRKLKIYKSETTKARKYFQ